METIYKNAVEKRNSLSSEEAMEISDDSLEINNFTDFVDMSQEREECRGEQLQTPEEHANKVIQDAERAKAKIFPPTGKPSNEFAFIAKMDQNYLIVGNHVDEVTQQKIWKSEYIDFGKLLPKDKILAEEENRLELIVKGGKTFWSPVSETVTINSFGKWEQAFRVFSNIYTKKFPKKAGELIEYNHLIHTISLTIVWENVYAYDKEFRIHISHHPERSWAVILQQAWSIKLKDRLAYVGNRDKLNTFHNAGTNSYTHANESGRSSEPCHRYNRGKCKFGPKCRYEHKCSYCNETGRGILHCRKLKADMEKNPKGGINQKVES